MESRELPFVREMFDNIAPRYDLLNRLLSLRQDVVWRKKLVSAMVIPENGQVLDVACGTGDLSMEICRQKGPLVKVIGIDFFRACFVWPRRKSAAVNTRPSPCLPATPWRYPLARLPFTR